MVSEGPTTAGSINAKIGATITELQAKVAEAKAAVKGLTDEKTNVKVDANVAEAIAKIDAVRVKMGELETQNDALRASLAKTNDTNGNGLRRWQLIAIAVAALIPLLGPLAGYAVGVAGALGGMGAAGVLAIVGIKNAMEQGTSAGNQFGAGIQILKGDLNELSQTSAVAMLDSWSRAISQINASMPFLNTSTKLFSQQLGVTGNLLLGGLLTGLRVIQPLLLTAGVYVEQLAAGFLSWTKNGGLQSFTQYAIAQLPKVAQALGDLAQLAIRFIQATSPIGTVVLQAVSAFSTAVSAIPLPVLTALIAGGGAFFLAYKAWAALTPILQGVAVAIGAVGAAEDLALGPIGLVIAAVTALGAAVGITAVSMQQGAQAQQDYTASIQQDNGVIGENVKLQAAKALGDGGALAAAKQLGISTETVTRATLGNSKAQAELAEKLKQIKLASNQAAVAQTESSSAYKKGLDQAEKNSRATEVLTQVVQQNRTAVKDGIKAYNEIASAQGLTTISTKEQLQAQVNLAGEYGSSVGAYLNAKGAQKQTADQLKATTVQMQLQNDAAGLLKQALDILDGKSLGVAEAQTGLASANNSLTDSLKQNGAAIDGNSKQAVSNQQAVQQSIQAAEQYAEAVGKSTGSSEQARQALIDSKKSMEDTLRSQGLLTGSVQAYIDKIFQIPASVPTTKVDVDDKAARKKLAEFNAFLKEKVPTDVRLAVHLDTSNNAAGGTIGRAGGGSIPGFSGGGGQSGTVYGPGSSTSDSILARLSRGEEVTKTSSAEYPGVRPLLKAINSDPAGTMSALNAPHGGKSVSYTLQMNGTGWTPEQLFAEFTRRMSAQQNARVA